ncbi:PREDICTED: bifunctional glutamate/proline--tRNA ligase isoform X2 [Polistes dominula]|uniref:Bifunctional glutamate/proline--tRNA ligase isoform X2 n=1 Tax=Polistes dominula TaxID=743375 RepID=A0ABM1J0L5_POLDO|nr:PREDICTED: bifunctional glutamate/proline--tRNA ligase isoform X2 [Polistes dominula]
MMLKLKVNSNNPPTDALIIAELINCEKKEIDVVWCNDWKEDGNLELLDSNDRLLAKSGNEVARYIGRTIAKDLYGNLDARGRTEIDHWLSFAVGPLRQTPAKHEAFSFLNKILMTNTWLADKKFTIADISIFCALLSLSYLEEFKKLYPCVTRWYKQLLSFPAVTQALSSIENNKMTIENNIQVDGTMNKKVGVRKQEGKFIDLPGAEMGKVVVRFPPEASGYLHIGHAKAALLNQYYAETFKGQLIMRFDDTNPAKENLEFEEAILEDIRLLNIKPDRFTYSSDYFDLMLDYCTKLIKDGKAFVDDTPALLMKEQRDQKLKSSNRDNSVEKNLELWNEMQKGSKKGQECCVRAKIDYESVNGCLRDPTIYRCKPEPHPRTGTKYKVYPIYDFACPIVDAVENVTHTLRTTEYHDRDVQYYWIIEALGLNRPYIWEYSRLNMTNTVLSKRKLTWFVENGLVDGWDDPRFPTVRGILRRGMTVEGLKQFIIAQGSSRSVVFMEWDKIWSFNKKVIDPIAIRYTALDYDNTVPVNVLDSKEEWLTVQNHPKDPSLGTKRVRVGSKLLIEKDDAEALIEGQNATFVNWGNLKIEAIHKKNGSIESVDARLNLSDENYKNTLKITWLPAPQNSKDLIPCYAVYFDHIIRKPILGKDDDFKNFVAKDTRVEIRMLGESELNRVKKGEIIQLQRKGFFRCDVPYADRSTICCKEQPLILFHIPDGHTASKSVKTSAVDSKGSTVDNKTSVSKIKQEDVNIINDKIIAQGHIVRHFKAEKADKFIIDAEVKTLLKLKADFKAATGKEWKPKSSSNETPAKVEFENTMKQLLTFMLNTKMAQVTQKKTANIKETNISNTANNVEILKNKSDIVSENKINDKLSEEIQKQGDKVRQLKSEKASKEVIDQEVKVLLNLKSDYKTATGQEWKPIQAEKINATAKSTENKITDKLFEEIQKQDDKVRQLKSTETEKSIIDKEVKILLSLKNDYKIITGIDWKSKSETTPKKKKKDESAKSGKKADKNVTNNEAKSKDIDSIKTGTRLGLEAQKEENFADWYSQVITKSGLIEYYDISGCYILRPWSFMIWKVIKEYFDKKITKLGVQECYFPMFVTRAALEKEKAHITDFAPEVAWVTKCGDSDMAEHIAIRPTSETVMYPAFSKWIRSDTELPLRLNQWSNVVRWEFKDPKPFLRTREFLWQEGHTVFANKKDAEEEVLVILDMYAKIYEDLLAVPVIKGRKTEKEKFAGSDYTTTVEAFISTNGRAIQGATSHHLGQNFSKMFNIQIEGAVEGEEKTYVYQNSWGLTTRTIGVMIMVHGDDKGLVLPPNVASVQAVIVPCGITATTTVQQKEQLMSECLKLENDLSKDESLRITSDYRNNRTPGWKFNHWELKGVPVRIELGPKDLEKNQVTFVRRDNCQKVTASREEAVVFLRNLLNEIQSSMFNKAKKTLDDHTKKVEDWSQFIVELNKKNLLLSPFCGEISCEDNIKADSARDDGGEEAGTLSMGAKSLCIPFEQPQTSVPLSHLKCIYPSCKNKPKFYTLFGRSY